MEIGHTISAEYVLSVIGAFFMFAISLGTFIWRMKAFEQSLETLKTEITAIAAKTEAEFRINLEKTSDWRENAVGKFATREEVMEGYGKRISGSIDNLTRELTRNK